jgi:L-serine dehydratase
VECAAEIGEEHNLGLTCDPIGGLVQIHYIERNAMGSVKAINASRLALKSKGVNFVSLGMLIRTMKDTDREMHTKYKELSREAWRSMSWSLDRFHDTEPTGGRAALDFQPGN